MINHQKEQMLSLAEAVEFLRPMRPHLAVSTLYRWSLVGIRGIKLDYVQLGGIRLTSKEELDRFFAAIKSTPRTRITAQGSIKAKTKATQKRRQTASREAARVLARSTRG